MQNYELARLVQGSVEDHLKGFAIVAETDTQVKLEDLLRELINLKERFNEEKDDALRLAKENAGSGFSANSIEYQGYARGMRDAFDLLVEYAQYADVTLD